MKLKSIICLVFCVGVVFNLHGQILPAAFGVYSPSRPVGSNLGSSGPIITSGLVLLLDAGNTSSYSGSGTTWTDLSGNNNHGTLINGPTYSSTNGGSLVLDGSNDYVDFGNSASLRDIGGTTNITVSGWAYYTAYGGGGQSYSVITVKGAPWTWLLENYLDTFRFRIVAGGADVSVDDVTTHQLNVWYNVVGTYDGSNMRLYINGVLKNTVPQTGALATNSETAKIGTWQGTNYNLTGRVSNVSIYNRVLTAAEVLENYNALRSRFGDVTNPTTGRTWMDRNLGATQVATSMTDTNSYGHYYQWGRGTDGHQLTTSTITSTTVDTDTPGNSNFFQSCGPCVGDWRTTRNDNLWQGVNGINNPCPAGYRLPTEAEWIAEHATWSSNNYDGAFASRLKLPAPGFRHRTGGGMNRVGTEGSYWSSTSAGGEFSKVLVTRDPALRNIVLHSLQRAYGFSVRCIKD
jgi:uncharacterized protein (TIGR02145 family)